MQPIKQKTVEKNSIIFFLLGAILLPPLQFSSSLPTIRPEIFVVLLAVFQGKVRFNTSDNIIKVFRALLIVSIIAILSSYLFFDTPFSYRDFMILPMIIQYLIIYSYSNSIRDQGLKFFALKLIIFFIGISAVIGIAQKFNLAGVNNWLTPIYIQQESQIKALQQGLFFGRSSGTVGDPRHFAYLLNIGLAGVVAALIIFKPSYRLLYVFALFLMLAALIVTASRTGLLAVFVLLLCALFLVASSRKLFFRYFLTIGIFIPVMLAIYLSYVPEETKERLFSTSSESHQISLAARRRDNFEPFLLASKQPLILITGRGPSKEVLPGSEHSDIGWMTLRFGIPGLICYVFIFLKTYRISVKKFKQKFSIEEKVFSAFSILSLSVWFVYILAESIFKNNQLMSINVFFIGAVFSSYAFFIKKNLSKNPLLSESRSEH